MTESVNAFMVGLPNYDRFRGLSDLVRRSVRPHCDLLAPRVVATFLSPRAVVPFLSPRAVVPFLSPRVLVTFLLPRVLVTFLSPRVLVTFLLPRVLVTFLSPRVLVTLLSSRVVVRVFLFETGALECHWTSHSRSPTGSKDLCVRSNSCMQVCVKCV